MTSRLIFAWTDKVGAEQCLNESRYLLGDFLLISAYKNIAAIVSVDYTLAVLNILLFPVSISQLLGPALALRLFELGVLPRNNTKNRLPLLFFANRYRDLEKFLSIYLR